ncbi:MAG: siroheme synthase [Sphingobacteriales bacterium]|nr:siroheme synthase [Sphingobacteriales bacterium]
MSLTNKGVITDLKKDTGNELFPVFLKLNQLHVLLVGAGNIGLEKLEAILNNSPDVRITIVSREVSEEVSTLVSDYSKITVFKKEYDANDLNDKDLVVVATNNPELNEIIRADSKARRILINVADKPALCDFYLGSIVKKGNLKLGISTNGKSPTIAKRLKEVLQESLPDELDQTLSQMNNLRNSLTGDFAYKVKQLNKATAVLVTPTSEQASSQRMRWILSGSFLSALAIVFAIFWQTDPAFHSYVQHINPIFYYFLFAGFLFAMVDGAIGMSYGVTSNTFSIAMGIPPASASAAVHISEILSNGIAGWMHYRMKNVNMQLFKKLLIPGIIGAVLGAFLLSSLEHYSQYTKPVVSLYTLILGIVILRKSANKKAKKSGDKIKRITFLGFGGGFIDAVGGGGWGSIVLSSLIAGGRHARYSLGSVKLSRFFIALMSSLTFITMLKDKGIVWEPILGLVIGSAIASPIAAKLSSKISAKSLMVAVGLIVIAVSLYSIVKGILKVI